MKRLITRLCFAVLFILDTSGLLSQENSAWISINIKDFESFSVDKKLKIINNKLFGSETFIYNISKPLPSSKREDLQKVYEIHFECDFSQLFLATSLNKVDFGKLESAPKYELLYDPNDFSLHGYDYALHLINATSAFDLTHGDENTEIAIIDGNYNVNHEDFVSKIAFVESVNSYPDANHGTCVAIIAGGATDNGFGKSSMGFNSKLQLRAMNYNAILDACYSGAKVINLSWTSGCFDNSFTQSVIDEVYENGCIVVAAAGNGVTCGGSSNFVYPASHNHVLSVSSVGPLDNHERYIGNSNSTHQHNSKVDLCAPGYDVLVSPQPGMYLTGNGTSFAAPYVSGLVALLLAVNHCLTPDAIELILKQSAVNLDSINPNYVGMLGAGRIDAFAAVQLALSFNTHNLNYTSYFDCENNFQSIELLSAQDPSFEIFINSQPSTFHIDNVIPNINYTIQIIDSVGCVSNFMVNVDTLYPISYQINIEPISCFGVDDGSISVQVTGGNGVCSVQWDNNQFGPILSNLGPGIYNLSIRDHYNCQIDDEIFISGPDSLTTQISYEQIGIDGSGVLQLNIFGGTFPYSQTWNTGQNSPVIFINDFDFYEVEVSDSRGCSTSGQINLMPFSGSISDTIDFVNYASLHEIIECETILLYPNPVSSKDILNIETSLENYEIELFSTNGVDVTTKINFLSDNTMSIEKLSKGVYYCHFIKGNQSITKQLIIY